MNLVVRHKQKYYMLVVSFGDLFTAYCGIQRNFIIRDALLILLEIFMMDWFFCSSEKMRAWTVLGLQFNYIS